MGALENPPPRTQQLELPIINVSDKSPINARTLIDAAVKYGFLYVSPSGTPFSEDLINNQFNLSKEFFAYSTPQKTEYHVAKDNKGWLGMHNEILDPAKQTKEFKEAFNIGEFDENDEPRQRMPACLSSDEAMRQLRAFQKACERPCGMILDLMGVGLEIEGGYDWFTKRHGRPSGCTVRLLHYPSLPEVSYGFCLLYV